MANSKGLSSVRNVMHNGKHSLLPPKIPFPSISPLYAAYVPSSVTGAKGIPKPRDGNPHHQRTSSESFLIEDQPSWLDELLNEPETPLHRGHRRASSDSFAYMDAVTANMDYAVQDEDRTRNLMAVPSWMPQDLDYYKDARHASFYSETNSVGRSKNRTWESPVSLAAHPTRVSSADKNFVLQNSESSRDSQEGHGFTSTATEKKNAADYCPNDVKASSERKDLSYAQALVSETDTKRAKQQFAQRSRVRKLQYIAELERNVQALEVKGSEVSAELEFLNQKNLILGMENEALKQRLENVAQEQRIKYLEHEVLEKEIGRLRALYQQQQLPPQQKLPSSTQRRTSSRDLNSQFAGLSLKNKASSSSRDAVSGPLHI